MAEQKKTDQKNWKTVFKELVQPFIDLTRTSKALMGVNLSYLIEGITYFGVIGLLAIFFNNYIGLNDIDAGRMVGLQTAGITLGMLLLGATVDWIGIRKAFLISLIIMLGGRILLTLSPTIGFSGIWRSAHFIAMLGIFGIIAGYGIYQPAAYAAVKKLSTRKNSAMGYAMLYAVMNLGGFLPGLISPPIRRNFQITGVFWTYVILTLIGIVIVYLMITQRSVKLAMAAAKLEEARERGEREYREETGLETEENEVISPQQEQDGMEGISAREKLRYYIKNFPLKDIRFLFFIFILIPVQTLFAHNWLTLPQYTHRAFKGFVSNNFELFVNFNPLLIFVLTPIVTALTVNKNPYRMMITGTLIMALPAFILTIGPNFYTLMAYLIIMTIGEAMWYPRFLQWVADLAPKNMTGIYMGIGQFPWFLTKVITSLYSGWFLMRYCPGDTPVTQLNTETMWLIYGLIALVTPLCLWLAKSWMMKHKDLYHQ